MAEMKYELVYHCNRQSRLGGITVICVYYYDFFKQTKSTGIKNAKTRHF